MKLFFTAYGAALTACLILDALWLGFVAKDSYVSAMAGLLRAEFIVWPWVVFYLLYNAAIVHLAVMPHLAQALSDQGIWKKVMLSGASLGLAAYGAYNLTNYALIKGWPLSITLKDWVWGTSLTAAVSLSAYCAARFIISREQNRG